MKIDSPLPLTCSWCSVIGAFGGSAASAKRSMRVPSARATFGSAAQTPVARPSTFTVTSRRAGSSRFFASPPSLSVTSSISMSAVSSRSRTTSPFQRLALPKSTCSTAECSRVRPPGTGSTTAGPAGSPSEPVRVSARRKPSVPVSRSPSSFSTAPWTFSWSMRSPPAALLTPATLTVLCPAKKSRNCAGTSGERPPLKFTSKPRPASLDRSATTPWAMRSLVGVEAEVDVHVVERARALHLEIDRGLALDLEQRGDEAALRLLQREVDVELPGLVGEAGLEGQRPSRPVEPLDVEVGGEDPAGQVERACRREVGRLAEHLLVETDAVELQLRQVDRDRQLGQRERLGLGAGQLARRRLRLGAAQPGDALGVQQVDRDAAAQQGEPVPVDLDVVDLEPGPLVVGDGDAADLRLRRKRAGHAAELDLAARSRQLVLQQVEQEAVVVRCIGGVLSQGRDRHEHQQAQRCQQPFQNACPMPM